MGVAVSVSTSRAPLFCSSALSLTPNLCCSSMTARERSLKRTLSESRDCVPKTTLICPLSSPESTLSASIFGVEDVSKANSIPSLSATGANFAACWEASISVGAITAH